MADKFGYNVKIKLISIAKKCHHEVGSEWIIPDTMFIGCPTGLCGPAFYALYPDIRAMKYGPESPSDPSDDVMRICCPDYGNAAIFEITRMRQ